MFFYPIATTKSAKSPVCAETSDYLTISPTYLSYSLSFTFMTIIYQHKAFLHGKDNTEKKTKGGELNFEIFKIKALYYTQFIT